MGKGSRLQQKFAAILSRLNERERRLFAARKACQRGYGGVSAVSRVSGLSRWTISRGLNDLDGPPLAAGRVRRPGSGRPQLIVQDPALATRLEARIEPLRRGDINSPLRWTCKSTRQLAAELTARRHSISHEMVAQLLRGLGYSLQGNRRTVASGGYPDRDQQFKHINLQVQRALRAKHPVISVSMKRPTERHNNKGSQGRATKRPDTLGGHGHSGSAAIDAHIVSLLCRWWQKEGRPLYPVARRLLIALDDGKKKNRHLGRWQGVLQRLTNAIGLPVQVCHLPPGVSKWNRTAHCLFSFVSPRRRKGSSPQHEMLVRLIGGTAIVKKRQATGRRDRRTCKPRPKTTLTKPIPINLQLGSFAGKLNYFIRPNSDVAVIL
jgi:hypothetical protein